MLFLGRSTQQWLALIAIVLSVSSQFVGADAMIVGVHLSAVLAYAAAIDAALMAWVAQTSTTPTTDPQLKVGTMVRVTDATGTIIGHQPVPQPAAPPVADPAPTNG